MKYCIFNSKKICDNCGECERCSLNPNKKCDNCGKCLEMEGYDTKAINITEVFEDDINKETKNNENDLKIDFPDNINKDENNNNENIDNEFTDLDYDSEEYIDVFDKEDMLEYIDDVKDLSEILNDDQFSNNLTHEQYPGLVILNKDK